MIEIKESFDYISPPVLTLSLDPPDPIHTLDSADVTYYEPLFFV